jgi:hypothetical protein
LDLRHKSQLTERNLKSGSNSSLSFCFVLFAHFCVCVSTPNREDTIRLTTEAARLSSQLSALSAAAQSEAATTAQRLSAASEQYIDQFRVQTIQSEEDRAILKAQYTATQVLYEKRIAYLEGRVMAITQK